jgi:hypothetical protein
LGASIEIEQPLKLVRTTRGHPHASSRQLGPHRGYHATVDLLDP